MATATLGHQPWKISTCFMQGPGFTVENIVHVSISYWRIGFECLGKSPFGIYQHVLLKMRIGKSNQRQHDGWIAVHFHRKPPQSLGLWGVSCRRLSVPYSLFLHTRFARHCLALLAVSPVAFLSVCLPLAWSQGNQTQLCD